MTGKINEEIVIITIQFIDCLLCSGTVPSISYILISNSKQAYGLVIHYPYFSDELYES